MEIDSSINLSYVGMYDSATSNDQYNELLESYEILSLDNDKLIKLILDRSYSKRIHHFEQTQITYQPDKIELEVISKFFIEKSLNMQFYLIWESQSCNLRTWWLFLKSIWNYETNQT